MTLRQGLLAALLALAMMCSMAAGLAPGDSISRVLSDGFGSEGRPSTPR
jgi:hypothetical protein